MPDGLRLALAAAVVLGVAVAVVRRAEIRLAMVAAGLLLGVLGGRPAEPIAEFLRQLSNPTFVVPICLALGFAEACKAARADAELVRLLLRPARRVGAGLLPTVAALAFVVNIPVVSQTGAAIAVGSVAVPLLLAAGATPTAAAAALALGASIGGELLNPAGTEYLAIAAEINRHGGEARVSSETLLQRNWPAALAQGAAAILAAALLWRKARRTETAAPAAAGPTNWPLALAPLVPLALLFLTARGIGPFPAPPEWFASAEELRATPNVYKPRWIGAAMLVGVAVAMAAAGRARTAAPAAIMRGFWTGAGHAYADIVSLIVAASCFAAGVKSVGAAAALQPLAAAAPGLLLPLAAVATGLFALLCGSGIAATQGLFPIFLEAAPAAGIAPEALGAAMCAAGAAGRTASPAAAVNLLAAKLAGAEPVALARRNAWPILFGAALALALGLRR